jgi:hypothetical protein
MTVIPVTKFDVDLNQNTYEDNSIQGDRMERTVIPGTRKVGGSTAVNLSASNYGPLLETALFSAFASDVLKTGLIWKTLTFEKWHADISKGMVYTGCFVDKLQLKVPVNGIVTLDATIAGMSSTAITASLDASPTAATDEVPFTHLGGTFMEGGAPIGYFSSIDLNIDNGSNADEVLGSATPAGYTPGMSKISGTVSAYFPDLALYNKFLNRSGTALQFTLSDGTNTLDFLLPNVTYTTSKIPVSGQAAVIQTLQFKAVKDSTAGSNIVITRS